MKSSIVFLLFLFVAFSSCNEYGSVVNSIDHKAIYNHDLVEKDTIVFGLDSITSQLFSALEYNSSSKTMSFIAEKNILVYDYVSKSLIRKISINSSYPTSYSMLNTDSIYIIDYGDEKVLRINQDGNVLNEYKIIRGIKYFPLPITKISPVVFKDNALFFTGNVAGEYIDENESNRMVLCKLDLGSGKVSYFVPYPDIYQTYNWGGALFRWVYSDYNADRDLFVFSFPADNYIYTISDDMKQMQKYYAGSRHIDVMTYFERNKIIPIDSETKVKHYAESHSYANIIFDKYRNVYYRIAELGTEYNGIPGWQKEISIIIMDRQFQIIGETFVGKCNLNYKYAIFVNEYGLHIPQITSEDVLCFKRYELCKK